MLKKIVTVVLCLFILAAEPMIFSVAAYADEENMSSENTDMVLDGLLYENGYYHYYENGERFQDGYGLTKWIDKRNETIAFYLLNCYTMFNDRK